MSKEILARMGVILSANNAEFNRVMNQSNKTLGGFASSAQRLGAVLGVALGGTAIFQGIKNGIGIMAEFEKTMSEVKAITGATGEEFKKLENDAMRLGSSTKFTASEVGQLQVAYGRLGFTTKEILDATEATLDLAAATGEDLAKSADVAGSTVRGFQLNANETQRVVDVMAASFNKTALGLDNFTESMKYVAPVAAAAGATVEETTALLGVLADAGIRGSMAGTSLRKIFTDMTKDGRPLKERLAELAAKGITLADSFDEVGRTAQTSLLILSKNTEKTAELTQAFSDVTGEASKMARIMSDNLTGDVIRLTSAWDGLLIKMGNTGVFRKITQDLTGIVNALSGTTDMADELRILAQAIKEGYGEIEGGLEPFLERLREIRKESGKPIDAVNMANELAEKFKLTDTQANKLYSTILEINKSLSFQEKVIQKFTEFAERNGYQDLTKAMVDYKQSIYELVLAENINLQKLKEAPGLTDVLIKKTEEQIAGYRRAILVLNQYSESLQKVNDIAAPTAPSMDFAPIPGFPDPNPATEFKGPESFSDYQDGKPIFELSEERLDQLHEESLAVMGLTEAYIDLGSILTHMPEKQKEVDDSFKRTLMIAQQMGTVIGEAFGDAATSQEKFTKSLEDSLPRILGVLFASAMGAIINAGASEGSKSGNVIVGTLAAAAGSAFIGSIFKSKTGYNGSNSSVRAFSSQSNAYTNATSYRNEMVVSGEFVFKNGALSAAIKNENVKGKRTG